MVVNGPFYRKVREDVPNWNMNMISIDGDIYSNWYLIMNRSLNLGL